MILLNFKMPFVRNYGLILAAVSTINTTYVVYGFISDNPSDIEFSSSADALVVIDFQLNCYGNYYEMFTVDQFPENDRETAMLIKEKIIQSLVDSELATSEDFSNPRSILIKYPINHELIRT